MAALCSRRTFDPPNEPSLAFDRRRGFREVGRLGPAGPPGQPDGEEFSAESTRRNVTSWRLSCVEEAKPPEGAAGRGSGQIVVRLGVRASVVAGVVTPRGAGRLVTGLRLERNPTRAHILPISHGVPHRRDPEGRDHPYLHELHHPSPPVSTVSTTPSDQTLPPRAAAPLTARATATPRAGGERTLSPAELAAQIAAAEALTKDLTTSKARIAAAARS